MKKNILWLLCISILSFVLGYGAVFAQSIPAIGNAITVTTINQPYTENQCIEPNGTTQYIMKHFYLGDTYTTRDLAPRLNAGWDQLFLTQSRVLLYNPTLFNFTSPIQWRSNGVPSNAPVNNVLALQGTFVVNSTNPGQLIYNLHRTALENAGSSSYAISYIGRSNLQNYSTTLTNKKFVDDNFHVKNGYECVNYTVHYCGDGTRDTQQSIANIPGGITTSIANEQCDYNDPSHANRGNGGCSPTCTQINLAAPTCTLTPATQNILLGQNGSVSWNINGNYTNTPVITYAPTIPNITGLPYTINSMNGTRTFTPTAAGTKTLSMTVSNSAGSNTCTANVTVTQPQQLECTLNLSPNPVYINQIVTVGWNVTGGNFFGTYIYVNPPLLGAWPHHINANQYNGITSVQPTQVGDYTFTMMVNNNQSSALCTGVLHVIPEIVIPTDPTCELTTSTPIIVPGEIAILSGGYTNGTLTSIHPNIMGLNFIYPNRNNNNISVTPTQTTTYTMYVNGAPGTIPAICNTTVTVANPSLQLDKLLVTNILYHSGDVVEFKINFSNNSANTVNNVILADYLPPALEYLSSELYGVMSPYTFGTGSVGNSEVVEYSEFSLAPGQHGYMLIRGTFKGYAYSNYTINHAFIQGDNVSVLHDSALFYAYIPNANATITKIADKVSYYPGESSRFTIAVTNNGPDIIDHVQIVDTWPTNNNSCLSIDTNRSSNLSTMTLSGASNNPYIWDFNTSLGVGQTTYLYLTGHIGNTPNCVGSYTNIANLNYMVNGQFKTGQANVAINASLVPSSTMSIEKNVIQYGNNPGDPIIFELLYQNNGTATITQYNIVDYRPGTLNFVAASPMPTTQTMGIGGLELHWIMNNTPLAPNGSGKIIINGTIK